MKISQMPLSTTPSSDDVLAMLEGGTQNKKITFGAVAEWIANEEEIDNLNTNSKTIVGAINELEELTNDLPTSQEEIEQLRDSAYITGTASGDIAVFSDGAAADAKSVVIHVEPVQSGQGDPSPDNIRPITGRTGATVYRTGKNLLPNTATSQTVNGITFTVNSDGSVTVEGTSTDVAGLIIAGMVANNYAGMIISGSPAGSSSTSAAIAIQYWDNGSFSYSNFETGNGLTLAASDQISILIRVASGITVNTTFYPMIRPASITDATYAPYTGTTYPVSWETEAGTVYGGELDVVSGVLTVDRALYTFTGLESQYVQQSGRVVVNIDSLTRGGAAICSDFAEVLTANGLRYAYITTALTAEELKAYMQTHTVQIVYSPLESQIYQLTPQQIQTLLGENVIYSDAGSVSVDYRADAKSYINSLFDSIQKNMAYIEDGTTASRAYTVGQYVIVNGTMYKVTAAIASGAEFTPGTNIVATTVGTELTTALNA